MVIGGWRKLHEEHKNIYFSLNIIKVIKSRKMRPSWHVACMERRKMHTGFRFKKLKERDHIEDLGINGRVLSN